MMWPPAAGATAPIYRMDSRYGAFTRRTRREKQKKDSYLVSAPARVSNCSFFVRSKSFKNYTALDHFYIFIHKKTVISVLVSTTHAALSIILDELQNLKCLDDRNMGQVVDGVPISISCRHSIHFLMASFFSSLDPNKTLWPMDERAAKF